MLACSDYTNNSLTLFLVVERQLFFPHSSELFNKFTFKLNVICSVQYMNTQPKYVLPIPLFCTITSCLKYGDFVGGKVV